MEFKNLNLNRNKLEESIKKCSGPDSNVSLRKKGKEYRYVVEKNGKKALLIFYFNKNGTTTINPKVGKNPDLSLELANCIKEKTLITKRKAFSLSFRDVEEDNFSLLLEYLEELNAEKLEDQDSINRRLLKFKSPFKDEIVITYYKNKTVLIQGKPLYLYTEIKLFFYEILSFEQVVKTEGETYQVDISSADVRQELESFLPTAFGFLDERIIKILTPSICLNKLEIDLEDYSAFVFPALRGLEGYIRALLKIKGKSNGVRNVKKLGSLFEDCDDYQQCLQKFAKDEIACVKTCKAIESAYSLYVSKRHALFHVSTQIQTTPIIWTKGAAEALVVDVLKTIEESYSQIVQL